MWQRFTWYDVRVIGHYLGMLVLFSSVALIVPLVTAIVFREWTPASHYLLSIGLSLIVGSALRFLRIEPGRLNRQQALVVTGLAWVVLAFMATIPLYLSGHYNTFLDAMFDGVSGITTTGVSIISDLDHLSCADSMWRFVTILLGGLGLVVVALSFGLFGKRSGASLYMSEGRSEHVVPNIVQTAQFIAKLSLGFICVGTAVLAVMCAFAGMEASRAFLNGLWLAISSFCTGGFAPMSTSILYYHSFPIEVVLMLLMIIGSVNFVLHSELWKGHLNVYFRDMEIRTMFIWIAVMTLVFAASVSASSDFSNLATMMRRGVFLIVSAFSTTGFQNVTTNQLTTSLTSGAFLVIAALMCVGGGAGSTSGGIKFNRMGLIIKSLVATVKETLAPDSARVVVSYYHLGRRILSPEVVKQAMTVFVLYVVTYAVGALVGHGLQRRHLVGRMLPGHARVARAILYAGDVGRPSGVSHVDRAHRRGCGDARPSQSGEEQAGEALMMRKGMAAAALAFALALPAFACPQAAFADEPAEGDNAVNVTQLPDSSFIYDTSITDLSTADTYYDKQTVQVTGEVVGDRITAGDGRHCWLQLASPSDSSTVSVYLTNESADKVDTYGAYGRKGTTLQVRGTFNLACPDHDGASDLHAQVVTVTEKGKATPDEFDINAFTPGMVTVMIGLAMMVVFYLLRERQR